MTTSSETGVTNTLVLIEARQIDLHAPAPFNRELTLGDALLTPTRIYVRSLLGALRTGKEIKALAHITGGGFIENIPRVLPETLAARIDLERIAVPSVFAWLAEIGGTGRDEMLKTFNCGIGMVAVVPGDAADDIVHHLAENGESVRHIGEIVERTSERAIDFEGSLALER